MDLYFQGLAWFNKGMTPDNMAQAHSFYERALAADPDNVDALVGSALARTWPRSKFFCERSLRRPFGGGSEVHQGVVFVPDHGLAICTWEFSTY